MKHQVSESLPRTISSRQSARVYWLELKKARGQSRILEVSCSHPAGAARVWHLQPIPYGVLIGNLTTAKGFGLQTGCNAKRDRLLREEQGKEAKGERSAAGGERNLWPPFSSIHPGALARSLEELIDHPPHPRPCRGGKREERTSPGAPRSGFSPPRGAPGYLPLSLRDKQSAVFNSSGQEKAIHPLCKYDKISRSLHF